MNTSVATPQPPLANGVEPFIRETYRWFLINLCGMVALGFASHYLLPDSSYYPLATADALIWIVCGWFGWRRPIALTLPLFTLITGLFFGKLASRYSPQAFALGSLLTVFTFGGLSLFVHVTKKNFNFLRGFLVVSFWVLLGGCILLPLTGIRPLTMALTGLGVVAFACWILYDTSTILERADDELTPAVAALDLMLDIVGLHRWITDLLDLRKDD